MKKWRAIEITMVALFVSLMAAGANITSFLVIGGVPVTLQTFFAILAGLVLGKRLGSIAMIAYMLIGLIGIPIFSEFSGGFIMLFRPTFGFIIGFILTAYAVGFITEKNKSLPIFIGSAFIGLIINYVFGTNWLYFAFKWWNAAPNSFNYTIAWSWMLLPLIKDILFTVLAAILGFRLQKHVKKTNIISNQ